MTVTTKVELGLNANPLDASPTWTEIDSDDVLSVVVGEGRQSLTDTETTSATCGLILDNYHREYDPQESGSSYFGSGAESALRPGLPVRVTAIEDVDLPYLGNDATDRWYILNRPIDDLSPDTVTLVGRLMWVNTLATDYQLMMWSTSGTAQIRLRGDGRLYGAVKNTAGNFIGGTSTASVPSEFEDTLVWVRTVINLVTGDVSYEYSSSQAHRPEFVNSWVVLDVINDADGVATGLDARLDGADFYTGTGGSQPTDVYWAEMYTSAERVWAFDPNKTETFENLLGTLGTTTVTTETQLFRGMVNTEGFQQVEYAQPNTYRARVMALDPLGYLAQLDLKTSLFGMVFARIAQEYTADSSNLNGRTWRTYERSDGLTNFTPNEAEWSAYDDFGNLYWDDGQDDIDPNAFADPIRPGLGVSVDLSKNLFNGYTHNLNTTSITRGYGLGIRLDSLPVWEDGVKITGRSYDSTFGFRIDGSGKLYASVNGGTDELTGPTLEIGKSYWVCMVFDADGVESTLYVDGVLQDTETVTDTTKALTANLMSNDAECAIRVSDEITWAYVLPTATQQKQLANAWHGMGAVRTDEYIESIVAGLEVLAFTSTDEGRTIMAPVAEESTNYAALLASAERTELGRLHYSPRDEALRFLLRKHLLDTDTRQGSAQLALSDSPDVPGLSFMDPQIVTAPRLVQVTGTGKEKSFTLGQLAVTLGGDGAASTSISTESYAQADPVAVAMALAGNRQEPQLVVSSITLSPSTDAELAALMDMLLFDRVRLYYQPTGTGDVIDQEFSVEGRSISLGGGRSDRTFTLFLSEAVDLSTDTTFRWGVTEFTTIDYTKVARS